MNDIDVINGLALTQPQHAFETIRESDLVRHGASLIHPLMAVLAKTDICDKDWLGEVQGLSLDDPAIAEGSFVYVAVVPSTGLLIAKDLTDPYASNWTRYIQGACDPSLANVQLVGHEDGRIYVQATREIRAGDEILLDFGPSFDWKRPRPISPLDSAISA